MRSSALPRLSSLCRPDPRAGLCAAIYGHTQYHVGGRAGDARPDPWTPRGGRRDIRPVDSTHEARALVVWPLGTVGVRCPAMPSLDLWSMLFVFMLATFVGFQVIQNVSRLLHTPLMSLTNAISAIAVVGSLLIAGERASD